MSLHLKSTFDALINLIFPERAQEKIVQTITESDIEHLPRAHILEHSQNIYSLFSYKHPQVQALIWELKYHRNNRAIEIVGRLLAEAILDELSDKTMFENWNTMVLTGIPLTHKRLRERKFSQTDLLCREIRTHFPNNITYAPDALKKIRETEKQSHSNSRQERLQNLRDSFSADPTLVSGKHIIVIDDVITTGATITEARRALKEAGAKSIIAFTVAH